MLLGELLMLLGEPLMLPFGGRLPQIEASLGIHYYHPFGLTKRKSFLDFQAPIRSRPDQLPASFEART